MSDSLRLHGLQSTRLPCPWDFPGKSTGVGCYCLLQIYIEIVYLKSLLPEEMKARQRLTEFYQDNALVIANNVSNHRREDSTHEHHQNQYQN